MKKKLISIVIPVFNNSQSLRALHDVLYSDLITRQKYSFEIIYVNDGSSDKSLDVLKEVSKKDFNVKIVNLSRNFGQYNAIMAGFSASQGDAVIDMAADLQDPPSIGNMLIEEWKKGNKIVIAYREKQNVSYIRNLSSKLFYKLILNDAPKGGFDVSLMDRQAIEIILSIKNKYRSYQTDILSLGFPVSYVPYTKEKRHSGKSQYTSINRLRIAFRYFFDISKLPIRIFSATGTIITLFSFLYSALLIINYFFGEVPYKGWTPLILLILFFGGMTLLGIGIIGEYVWRIYQEVKHRPNFIIDEIVKNGISEPYNKQ